MQPENKVQEMENALGVTQAENMMAQGVPDMGKTDGKGANVEKTDGEKTKMSKKNIIGLVVLSLIAIGGVLFGVYGMNSQNEQIAELKGQVSSVNEELAKMDAEIDESGELVIEDEVEIGNATDVRNPVIVSGAADEAYTLSYVSPTKTNGFYSKAITIGVRDGEIEYCDVGVVIEGRISYSQESGANSCEISGVEGKIYKIVDFGAGQDYSLKYLGIIMTDGTVHYLSFKNALADGIFDASNTLNIDGVITDAIDVNASVLLSDGQLGSGHYQTVFILNDGSYVRYDESMLN